MAEKQRLELKITFVVGSLFPVLVSRLIDQTHMSVNEDGPGEALNSAADHAGGALRDHNGGRSKTPKSRQA
jgi:hypothetical protein